MRDTVRRMLFSKQFFATLMVVLALDGVADIAELINPGAFFVLHLFAVAMTLVAFVLALLMFLDLHRRRSANGNDPRRR